MLTETQFLSLLTDRQLYQIYNALTGGGDAQLPNSLGQKAGAGSLSVVLSSDGPFATKFGSVGYTAPQIGASGSAITVTLAAAAGLRNVIEGISWSLSAAPASPVTLQIKDGATLMDQWYITSAGPSGAVPFPRPIRGTANTAMTATISAPGGSVVATVNFYGARTE